jgi:RNA polymerase sigma-70 factor (ECF subfamily)
VAGIKSFDLQKGTIESWLIGIARNNLALEMRQRASQPRLNSDVSRYLEKIDSEPLPDEILERKETAEIVRKAMGKLETKESKVLRAKYIDQLSAKEIAGQMEMTEKAVHSLLYRARNSLREKLKDVMELKA